MVGKKSLFLFLETTQSPPSFGIDEFGWTNRLLRVGTKGTACQNIPKESRPRFWRRYPQSPWQPCQRVWDKGSRRSGIGCPCAPLQTSSLAFLAMVAARRLILFPFSPSRSVPSRLRDLSAQSVSLASVIWNRVIQPSSWASTSSCISAKKSLRASSRSGDCCLNKARSSWVIGSFLRASRASSSVTHP